MVVVVISVLFVAITRTFLSTYLVGILHAGGYEVMCIYVYMKVFG